MSGSSAGWSSALCSCAAWLVVGCAQPSEPVQIAPAAQALALPEPLVEGRSSPRIAVRWSGSEAVITNTVSDAFTVTLLTTTATGSGGLASLTVGTYQVAGYDSQSVPIGSGLLPVSGDNIPVTLVALYQVEGDTRRAFSEIRLLSGTGPVPGDAPARGAPVQLANGAAMQAPEPTASFASRGASASDLVAPTFRVGKAGPP